MATKRVSIASTGGKTGDSIIRSANAAVLINVCFTPKSGHPQRGGNVRFVPKADIIKSYGHLLDVADSATIAGKVSSMLPFRWGRTCGSKLTL